MDCRAKGDRELLRLCWRHQYLAKSRKTVQKASTQVLGLGQGHLSDQHHFKSICDEHTRGLKKYFFLPKKSTFFCQKKVLLFAKKSTFFCKKKYLFLVIKTHFMPSNALLWEPQSHHQGRLSGLLSSPIKQMTPQTTRVPSPPSQWKKSTLPLLHLQKKVHWLIWIS